MGKPEKASGLKKECFKCGYFDPKMGASRYKCAITGRCPGIDWSSEHKQQAINRVIKRGVICLAT